MTILYEKKIDNVLENHWCHIFWTQIDWVFFSLIFQNISVVRWQARHTEIIIEEHCACIHVELGIKKKQRGGLINKGFSDAISFSLGVFPLFSCLSVVVCTHPQFFFIQWRELASEACAQFSQWKAHPPLRLSFRAD